MNGEMYNRLHELRKVLALHFSDLGTIIDFQFKDRQIAIMNHINIWDNLNPYDMITPYLKTGEEITVLFKFKYKSEDDS
jgi:hypothetical protein